jgi:arylsulfatase A-like enzyme
MHVPLAVNFKINKEYARTVDLYPTILHLMGHQIPERIDGISLVG